MGLLSEGTYLHWNNYSDRLAFIREKGVEQFIALYQRHAERFDTTESLKWGDEIEFLLVQFDDDRGEVYVYPQAPAIIDRLEQLEQCMLTKNFDYGASWHPEYSSFTVEAIPQHPYSLNLDSVLCLHLSMCYRRWKLKTVLPYDADVTTLTCFPLLGADLFLKEPQEKNKDRIAKSLFLPDEIISTHPRFTSMTENICSRRGEKVQIFAPLYIDKNTNTSIKWDNDNNFDVNPLQAKPATCPDNDTDITQCNPLPNSIYMDAMGFGMGMGCCQATYMCTDISSARYLYDQFCVLSPLWLALTACTPFYRGMIAATDTRWDVIAASVDCRRDEEKDLINKSRFSCASLYISDAPALADHLEEYNDLNPFICEEAYSRLLSVGIDSILARHVAFLFSRDPVVLMKESLIESDPLFLTHFDNIQSSNWNSVRFKPPPSITETSPDQEIGWRVEFRTPDLQLTDFENAAFVALLTVVTQVFMKERLDLYIPMSLNDDNFTRSSRENSVMKEKFWFRVDISHDAQDRTFALQSLQEIFLGSGDFLNHEFLSTKSGSPALLYRCIKFIDDEYRSGRCSKAARNLLNKYFDFLYMRICGTIETNATFMRDFIKAHPDYKQDSTVPAKACYDLCRLASRIGSLSLYLPDLFGLLAPHHNSDYVSTHTAEESNSNNTLPFTYATSSISGRFNSVSDAKAAFNGKNHTSEVLPNISSCETLTAESSVEKFNFSSTKGTSVCNVDTMGRSLENWHCTMEEVFSRSTGYSNSFFCTRYMHRYLFSLCSNDLAWRSKCKKALEQLYLPVNFSENGDNSREHFLDKDDFVYHDGKATHDSKLTHSRGLRLQMNELNARHMEAVARGNENAFSELTQYWLFCLKLKDFMINESGSRCWWTRKWLETEDDLSTYCTSLECINESCCVGEGDRDQS